MSSTDIDRTLWQVQKALMKRHTVDESVRLISPLAWYVNTGRASAWFMRLLSEAKPFLIARDLTAGGSDQEIVDRICRRLNYKPYGI